MITSASEVTEGNYVIVAGQGDSAMKNVGDSKGRISAEAVTVTDGVITDPDDSLVWTLTQDDDAWIISSETSAGTVYAAAPSSEGNSSRLLSALADTYTLWTIADSATADLITVGSYEYLDRCLQKNDSGAFFAC